MPSTMQVHKFNVYNKRFTFAINNQLLSKNVPFDPGDPISLDTLSMSHISYQLIRSNNSLHDYSTQHENDIEISGF